MTFSSAFRLAKSWTFWNVRARPSAATRCGGQPVMSDPSKRMRPSLGVRRPEIMLNVVVLPAPLGPIIAVTAARARANETCETATSPPKRMVTRSATSAAVPSVTDAPGVRRRVTPRAARRGRQLGERWSPLVPKTGLRISGPGPECQGSGALSPRARTSPGFGASCGWVERVIPLGLDLVWPKIDRLHLRKGDLHTGSVSLHDETGFDT